MDKLRKKCWSSSTSPRLYDKQIWFCLSILELRPFSTAREWALMRNLQRVDYLYAPSLYTATLNDKHFKDEITRNLIFKALIHSEWQTIGISYDELSWHIYPISRSISHTHLHIAVLTVATSVEVAFDVDRNGSHSIGLLWGHEPIWRIGK